MKSPIGIHTTDKIKEGMANAMWVDGWASAWEYAVEDHRADDLPWGPGDRIDLCAPERDDSQTHDDTESLFRCICGDNKLQPTGLADLCLEYGWDPEQFGWYLAMQALGHGVGWWIDEDRPNELKLPYVDAMYDYPDVPCDDDDRVVAS